MAYRVERNGWQYIAISVPNADPEKPPTEKRISLKTKDADLADDIVKDYNAAERWDLLGLPARSKKHNPQLTELFKEYLDYSKEHKHPSTHSHNKIYIEQFLDPAFGHIRIRELTDKHIEDFVGKLKNRTKKNKEGEIVPAPYHPETINKRLKCLRIVLKRAARPGADQIIDRLPVDLSGHLVRLPRSLPKYITPEQFVIWWPHISKPLNKWRAVIELCTSIPDSELAKLRWDKNYTEHPAALRYWRGKTKREIVVALNAWAQEAIEELKKLRKGALIFHGIKEARKAYEVASANSGIKVSPHMLRHSFATWALSSGQATLADIQRILGHADQKTTQIYADVMPQFLDRATNAMDTMRPPSTLPKASESASCALPVQKPKQKRPVKN
jgi:integrase